MHSFHVNPSSSSHGDPLMTDTYKGKASTWRLSAEVWSPLASVFLSGSYPSEQMQPVTVNISNGK